MELSGEAPLIPVPPRQKKYQKNPLLAINVKYALSIGTGGRKRNLVSVLFSQERYTFEVGLFV